MADVVIAFCNDTWWLVKGETHLDSLLYATEAEELTVSLVTSNNWSEVMKSWENPEFGRMPWAINPKIIERLKARPQTTAG